MHLPPDGQARAKSSSGPATAAGAVLVVLAVLPSRLLAHFAPARRCCATTPVARFLVVLVSTRFLQHACLLKLFLEALKGAVNAFARPDLDLSQSNPS